MLIFLGSGALALDDSQVPWRGVYCSTNFQVNERTSDLIDLLERAHRLGYDGMVLSDYKFGRIQGRPQHYHDNLRRVRKTADDSNMEHIPSVMPIGYSGSILQNNPDLAGELLARNVEGDTEIIREVNPDAEIFVWSDMFDPHHNARDNYCLSSGSLEGT